jgi:hypothetical protein
LRARSSSMVIFSAILIVDRDELVIEWIGILMSEESAVDLMLQSLGKSGVYILS